MDFSWNGYLILPTAKCDLHEKTLATLEQFSLKFKKMIVDKIGHKYFCVCNVHMSIYIAQKILCYTWGLITNFNIKHALNQFKLN